MSEIIKATIAQQDKQAKLLRKYKGGPVGFSESDSDPLVIETQAVVGEPVVVGSDVESKRVRPMARIITLSDSGTEIIEGGIGDTLTPADAKKILTRDLIKDLNEALKNNLEKKKKKFNSLQKSSVK